MAVLMLIGAGTGPGPREFSKEQKAGPDAYLVCTILSASGYYVSDGLMMKAIHFSQIKELPVLNVTEQEDFLKDHILLYFQNQGFL